MFENVLPKDEFWSPRRAALTNTRLFRPSRSSANFPMVAVWVVCSFTLGITPPASELLPAVRPSTLAKTPCSDERKYCSPADVVDWMLGVSRNDAWPQTFAVQL